MNLERSDTLSQEDKEAISSLTEDLQSIIDHAVPLLLRELHAESEDNSNSVREELKKDAARAQNERRRELREYLQEHALNDVYEKIQAKSKDAGNLQETAKIFINMTQDNILILLSLHGELFGLIDPNNYTDDAAFMCSQMYRIRELLPFIFVAYIKGTSDDQEIFFTRVDEALKSLGSALATNPPSNTNDLAESINAVVRSTNNILSHVRYYHSILLL